MQAHPPTSGDAETNTRHARVRTSEPKMSLRTSSHYEFCGKYNASREDKWQTE